MSSYSSSGRRRPITRTEAEERALDKISREAEARMKLKRETREQARQGRYQLLEKKVEEDAEAYRHETASTSNTNGTSYNENQEQLHDKVIELQDRVQQVMFLYSQLDNEKSTLLYEVCDPASNWVVEKSTKITRLFYQSGMDLNYIRLRTVNHQLSEDAEHRDPQCLWYLKNDKKRGYSFCAS
uniref:Uncharacterized protein n=1 Tax=Caenorhabditis japonica TaxID=281687 RepID=A0A8R1E881_CAEJA